MLPYHQWLKVLNDNEWNDCNRSSIITIHSTRLLCTWRKRWWIMFIDNAKYEWNWMKWLNLDLPNLTSIDNSDRWSFCNPRSVTLESILKYWILIWSRYSESSKCQTTLFTLESSIEINIEYCLIDLISFIDVPSILAWRVKIKQWFQYWIYIIDLFPFHSNNQFTTIIIPFNTHFLTYPLCSKPLINIPSSFLYHSIIIWLFLSTQTKLV